MKSSAQRGRRLSSAAWFVLTIAPAAAHDSWINKERRTNPAGEWCCNVQDCSVIPDEQVSVTPQGYYLVATGEFIAHAQAAVSGDNRFWACRRRDQSIRCFFFPPPGT
jgi:hypothetical protein